MNNLKSFRYLRITSHAASIFLSVIAPLGWAVTSTTWVDSTKSSALFQMERKQNGDTANMAVERLHRDSQGKLLAEEKLSYQNGKLKSFEFISHQEPEKGRVSVEGNRVKFEFTTATGKIKTGEEDFTDHVLVADQITPYLHANWDTLMAGKDLKVRYVAISRAETVGFKYFKDGEDTVDGTPVVKIIMKPSSFVIAALVNPLTFYMEKAAPHRLMALHGRVLPKIMKDGKYKDADGYTTYQHP